MYLAIQETFERNVVLKVMAEHLLRTSPLARFLREARLVAKMSHQNIVPVSTWVLMAITITWPWSFLPGGDLKKKMRTGLSLLESVKIVQAVAHGLNHAGVKPGSLGYQARKHTLSRRRQSGHFRLWYRTSGGFQK